jgi:hypothetical protein
MTVVTYWTLNPQYGRGTRTHKLTGASVNRHSRVTASISELGGPPGGPLDWPFIGAANMSVLNIAPADDGAIYIRVHIAWDSNLYYRIVLFVEH